MLKRNDTAPFDLLSWLEGDTRAEGVFEDRQGRIRRRFTVEMTGLAEGNVLRLDETFHFDDGERQQRRWVLTRGAGGSFTGRAGDSVSDAQGRFDFPAVAAGRHVITVVPDNVPLPWTLVDEGRREIEVPVRGTISVDMAARRIR